MIHFYYSENGQYNIENITDASESFIFDKKKNKLVLFGEQEFYFQKTSDVYTSNRSDTHLSFSQTGAYNLYQYIDSSFILLKEEEDLKILDLSTYTHAKVSELNTSISYVNTALLTKVNDLSTYSYNADAALNTSINIINTTLYDKINDLSTYTHNNVLIIDTSIHDTIERIQETEEIWSYTYNFLDSSIVSLETRVAALEAQMNS